MALYEQYYFSTLDIVVSDLASFAESNGWTINYDDEYEGHARRHISKGERHFEVWVSPAYSDRFFVSGCTGYDNELGPEDQPGSCPVPAYFGVGYSIDQYRFVSTMSCIYLGFRAIGDGAGWTWGVIGRVTSRSGDWSGGTILCGFNALGAMIYGTGSYATGRMQLLINGEWTPLDASGAVSGGADVEYQPLLDAQPFRYSLGVLPINIPLFLHEIMSFTPIGIAPGIAMISAGDVYSDGDEIQIGKDTWVVVPCLAHDCGNRDLIIKIGN